MLRQPARRREVPVYLDTPAGIITPAGTHFRTTEALLVDYAGEVLERVPLETLVRRSEVWLRSAQTLAVWVLAPALLAISPLAAAIVVLMLYLGWEALGPALANRPAAEVMRVAEQPLVQAILYVGVLSLLGIRGDLVAVGVGLVGFIAFRWQLIALALRPLVRIIQQRLFSLPAPDQVLRTFVLQAAIRHQVSLPQLEELRPGWPFGK